MSIRQAVNGIAERWSRVPAGCGAGARARSAQLAACAKRHSSEAFFGCDHPLEAAVFSALVGIRREITQGGEAEPRVDP